MTSWLPNIKEGKSPLYIRVADQIEDAIMAGNLPAGAKLPPQRNLAYDIGVTIGTISRAYSLLHERGLVSGEVGRGTYVRPRPEIASQDANDPATASFAGTRPFHPPPGKIRFDSTAAPDVGQNQIIAGIINDIMRDHPREIASYTRSFPDHWSEAGARWLSYGNWTPAIDSVVPTLGAHAGIMAIISSLTSPGDRIVFEHMTYSQISRAAGLIGRRSSLVDADDFGVLPEDFERVCVQLHPKIAFFMSSAQNPTLATLPLDRRRAIADIAHRHNVWLIEDNLYGAMDKKDIPLIAELAPDRTFVIDGLSKSVAAGTRGGWVACPPHFAQRVRIAHKMLTGGLPFMLAELCSRLVLSGEAERIWDRCRIEINAREELAREILAGHDFNSNPDIPFLWLKLPEPWLSATFKNAVLADGVLIDDEDEFRAGRSGKITHRVRIGFSSPHTRQDVAAGLKVVRRLLENGSAGYDSLA
ncbi:PLP-dependent aminotransferase family protein [Rhizobium sp. LC145]|uniref:aminotransferase-like domain-containing protein n=1 Tax=Rhizobium sp. LC145 TaxID=1120688 RepID=UPI00062A20BB|nr:PLP-dependent aminotransferase family protein [Rhizobium sp. LC145]KKX33853.1 GntR family transcriptional regulator [Rhizobium sp. LC145]TKT60037.1 PLP-dependent aminotransferase family protein [Rhizobiaceae bacterium LC148]